jgi:hypothetical protein
MAEDITELHERAEHGAEHSKQAIVTLTMAVLAVCVAAVSLMGHRSHTEEMLAQTRATDQWAYYQAKVIRERSYEVFLDQLSVFTVQDKAHADELRAKYTSEAKRYRSEANEIQGTATSDEAESQAYGRRSDRFDLGEVLLEAALVICSITLLTHKRHFWMIGSVIGIAGVVVAVTGFLIHFPAA